MPAKGQDNSCQPRFPWPARPSCSRPVGERAHDYSLPKRLSRHYPRTRAKKMNIHDPDISTPKVTTGPLPASRKVYAQPDAAPDLRVPVREIMLDASSGEPPLPVYDTTGPYTDPDVTIEVEKGLSRRRTEWVVERGGVEEYDGREIKAEDNGS